MPPPQYVTRPRTCGRVLEVRLGYTWLCTCGAQPRGGSADGAALRAWLSAGLLNCLSTCEVSGGSEQGRTTGTLKGAGHTVT